MTPEERDRRRVMVWTAMVYVLAGLVGAGVGIGIDALVHIR